MMAYSEDHIALAAEYALGTLDADERAQVESMMSADKDFTAVVVAWEHKLGALNQMVGSVEPRPELWEKIRAAIGHAGPQSPVVLPESVSLSAIAEALAAHGVVGTSAVDTPAVVDTPSVGTPSVETSAVDTFQRDPPGQKCPPLAHDCNSDLGHCRGAGRDDRDRGLKAGPASR